MLETRFTTAGGQVRVVDFMPDAVARFEIAAGEYAAFVLTWHPSHTSAPEPVDAIDALAATTAWWDDWSGRCRYDG